MAKEYMLSYTAQEIDEKLGKIDDLVEKSTLPVNADTLGGYTVEDILAQAGGTSGGAEGKSAYEIWLEQGNKGTEQDFIDSLKPVRGTDYWTETDKAEIKSYVDEAILGGVW